MADIIIKPGNIFKSPDHKKLNDNKIDSVNISYTSHDERDVVNSFPREVYSLVTDEDGSSRYYRSLDGLKKGDFLLKSYENESWFSKAFTIQETIKIRSEEYRNILKDESYIELTQTNIIYKKSDGSGSDTLLEFITKERFALERVATLEEFNSLEFKFGEVIEQSYDDKAINEGILQLIGGVKKAARCALDSSKSDERTLVIYFELVYSYLYNVTYFPTSSTDTLAYAVLSRYSVDVISRGLYATQETIKIGSGNKVFNISGSEVLQAETNITVDVDVDVSIEGQGTNRFTLVLLQPLSYDLTCVVVYGALDIFRKNVIIRAGETRSEQQATIFSYTFRVKDKYRIYKYTDFISERILNGYKDGKERISLVCNIGEYYYQDGRLAKSIKEDNALPMIFKNAETVIPYVIRLGKEEPISRYKDGNPKRFLIVGVQIDGYGSAMQKIDLIEVVKDDIITIKEI